MGYPIFVLSSQFFPKIYLVVFYYTIIHIYSLFPFTKSATHIAKIVGITNTKLVVNGIRNIKDLVISTSISIILVLLVNFLRGSKNIRCFGRNIKYHFERNCRLYLMLLCYLITKHITIRNASWWYKNYQMMCRWGNCYLIMNLWGFCLQIWAFKTIIRETVRNYCYFIIENVM